MWIGIVVAVVVVTEIFLDNTLPTLVEWRRRK